MIYILKKKVPGIGNKGRALCSDSARAAESDAVWVDPARLAALVARDLAKPQRAAEGGAAAEGEVSP